MRLAGFQPFVCSVPDGERHKTLATTAAPSNQLLAGGLDRSGLVLSLGGGVTGDIAGFAAATLMRGGRFAQVPTTVLSMADASVGGKTGVDLPQGKNLAGAFKQPVLVAIDPTVLATLPEEEVRSGMAEVIKHGCIGDPDLFAELESPIPNPQSPLHPQPRQPRHPRRCHRTRSRASPHPCSARPGLCPQGRGMVRHAHEAAPCKHRSLGPLPA